jgi:hypothetical protein
VIRIPYGSTELSRSIAQSRVNVSPAREAHRAFVASGMKAIASTGAAYRSDRDPAIVGTPPRMRERIPPSRRPASVRHTVTKPKEAHTPHAEKLQR